LESALTDQTEVIKTLDDNLVLRHARIEDANALADFFGEAFKWHKAGEPGRGNMAWTLDLMSGRHPTTKANDFTIVENTADGSIVSACGYISQRWTYDGIEFGMGRPEIVATHEDYRGRGLVRLQFDVLHSWAESRNEPVQVIGGIQYFYRQFGYDRAIEQFNGRSGSLSFVPTLKAGEKEPYLVREASDQDLPFLKEMYSEFCSRSMLACLWDDEYWHYDIHQRNEMHRMNRCIVETPDGSPVGMIGYGTGLSGGLVRLETYELRKGVSWLAVTPSVLRYLRRIGDEWAAKDQAQCSGVIVGAQKDHPIFTSYPDRFPQKHAPWVWYVRVPKLTGFLTLITSALEKRLADSAAANYSGSLTISFYRDGLKLVFDRGRITKVEKWMPTVPDSGQAAFPDLTFLQLLFGYRSLAEIRHAWPDCVADAEATVLLDALFPRRLSYVASVW
jgi:hypothetical protein